MAQYAEGTVTVTNGSQTVTGDSTLFQTAALAPGDLFTVVNDNVNYEVGTVDNETQITLSANYTGVTGASKLYAVTTSFTPINDIPYVEKGDIETATILKRAFLLIDTLFTGGGSGDMTKAVYDSAAVNEQLVGLTAIQTLTNKTIAVLALTGNTSTTGLIDGRDIAADGAKLDALDQAIVLKGTWDASVGTFPGGGVAQAGWTYIVSVAGTVDSIEFKVDDRIIAILDNASVNTFAGNWYKSDNTEGGGNVVGPASATDNSLARYDGATGKLLKDGAVIGTDVAEFDVDTLFADVADTLTAGFATTPDDFGTKTTGTFTPNEANGNFQFGVNGGAHTLAPPTLDSNIILQYTNDGSAGSITTSGFTKVTGSFTTTDGDDFFAYITKNNGFSLLQIVALQ